ncbi:MAG TPA: TerC family protein [Pseudonocardia sp.]|nr:TerC family protein [Pseudonocardia sp.]
MNVPTWIWLATVGALVAVILVDLFVVDHNPHAVTMREATRWVLFYMALAAAFGVGLWFFSGPAHAGEFFAGYITEYSLSVDNLFIFVIIMSAFRVPAIHQHRVLLVGIVIALIMRGAFIAVGAAAIAAFSWVFYLFAAVLFVTAYRLVMGKDDDHEYKENASLKLLRRVVPVTDEFHGARTTVKLDGRRHFTPMLVVMIAIGTTDLLFALDSIPAIFGLTQEPYLVFTANAFALMGLRQLYFLLGNLLNKLVYLSVGLSIILAFIGVKLVLEALHDNELPFINDGRPVGWAPEIGIPLSLGFIAGVLAITTVASLVKVRRHPEAARGVDGSEPGAGSEQGSNDRSDDGSNDRSDDESHGRSDDGSNDRSGSGSRQG